MQCALQQNKFSIVRKTYSLATTDYLFKAANIVFTEFRLIRHEFYIREVQIILQADEQRTGHNIILSPPDKQSGGSMYKIPEMFKFNLALLQIRSTPMRAGLPSPATLLFYRTIRGLLPQMNREPTNINNDDV